MKRVVFKDPPTPRKAANLNLCDLPGDAGAP
jgi:hypothetical protein